MELDNGTIIDKLDLSVCWIHSFFLYFMSSPLYLEHAALLKEAGVVTEHIDAFESTITKDDVLVLVDCQNDFFPEGTVEDGGRFGVAVRNVFS